MYYDQADVDNVGDFELLNDRMPPAAHTENFKTLRKEFGLAVHDNARTSAATRYRFPWRKAWRDELEKEVFVTSPQEVDACLRGRCRSITGGVCRGRTEHRDEQGTAQKVQGPKDAEGQMQARQDHAPSKGNAGH